jgi:O-acetyl-ADP-ribose deacetylase (regulator of RNase III)
MSIEFKSGDIFATPGVSAFAHGCNCTGVMGKGIAVAFKLRWPEMFELYRTKCKTGDFRLGDVFCWKESGNIVFNLGTQQSWQTNAELWAIESALRKMLIKAEAEHVDTIVMPRIGAGLGGLDWHLVKSRIADIGAETKVRLIVCETFVEGQKLI